jgi:undecaprenyl-diphosphatase
MGEKLIQLDERLFIFLNNLHAEVLDQTMIYMGKTYFWIPLHCFLAYLIIKQFKKDSLVIILCIALSIAITDQLTSSLMKPFFERLRPSHEPHLKSIIHLVNDYKGGLYGFASSHAANTFALATFIWLLLREYYRYVGWLFLWAIVVTYTRIYLGVHYPGDVIVGGLIGVICGWGCYRLSQVILHTLKQKMAH